MAIVELVSLVQSPVLTTVSILLGVLPLVTIVIHHGRHCANTSTVWMQHVPGTGSVQCTTPLLSNWAERTARCDEIRLDYHNVYYYAHSGHTSFIYFIIFVGFSWQCNRHQWKAVTNILVLGYAWHVNVIAEQLPLWYYSSEGRHPHHIDNKGMITHWWCQTQIFIHFVWQHRKTFSWTTIVRVVSWVQQTPGATPLVVLEGMYSILFIVWHDCIAMLLLSMTQKNRMTLERAWRKREPTPNGHRIRKTLNSQCTFRHILATINPRWTSPQRSYQSARNLDL